MTVESTVGVVVIKETKDSVRLRMEEVVDGIGVNVDKSVVVAGVLVLVERTVA